MWATLAPIIARYGVEFAFQLWENINTKTDPTPEQWAKLRELATKPYEQYIEEAKAKANPT